jgi:hypothetical protein
MWRITIALMLQIGAAMNVHASSEARCCPVIELRQYTLKPEQRDVLIDLFERYFVEAQESAGMTIRQFRDRARPDRFVWMRGFGDMVARHRALEQLYDGPVWAAHRTAANDTMLDSYDVLLLKPARPEMAFRLEEHAARASDGPRGVLAGIYTLSGPASDSLVTQFEQNVAPQLRARGIDIEGLFVTESARNTFTRLPVREGEDVLVWVGTLKMNVLAQEQLDELRSVSALDRVRAAPTLLSLAPTPGRSTGS